MGLTGIQIFNLLPKTNCKECGVPTCLAFAMNLAAGKAELASCPYVSEEAKALLERSGVRLDELVGRVRSLTFRARKPEACCTPTCCGGAKA